MRREAKPDYTILLLLPKAIMHFFSCLPNLQGCQVANSDLLNPAVFKKELITPLSKSSEIMLYDVSV